MKNRSTEWSRCSSICASKRSCASITTSIISYRSSCHSLIPRRYRNQRLSSMKGIAPWRRHSLNIISLPMRPLPSSKGQISSNRTCICVISAFLGCLYAEGSLLCILKTELPPPEVIQDLRTVCHEAMLSVPTEELPQSGNLQIHGRKERRKWFGAGVPQI